LDGMNLRVWSWLRANAGGMLNTCKSHGVLSGAQWRTGEYRVGIYPWVGDNRGKLRLIPHDTWGSKAQVACGGACVRLACWWGNGLPRRWSIAGLRGWSATLGRDARRQTITLTARNYNTLEVSVPLLTTIRDLVSIFCEARNIKLDKETREPRVYDPFLDNTLALESNIQLNLSIRILDIRISWPIRI